MSPDVFGSDYAGLYDCFYEQKDYRAETNLIVSALESCCPASQGRIRSIVDFGCGTGNHVFPLARAGFAVTGVDVSPNMLDIAAAKLEQQQELEVTLQAGDICDVNLCRTFDSAIMMFAVLGYMTTDEKLTMALANVRRHLAPGGCFLFDVWYGPAVLKNRPSERVRKFFQDGRQIVRRSDGLLIEQENLCKVSFDIEISGTGGDVEEISERHTMRYFFPEELKERLKASGFDLIRIGRFDDFDQDPDDSSWSILCLARAV